MPKSFILTNALSTCICGECFSSWVIMNQTPELTAPTASQGFHICCLTSKCILTSLRDFFFSFLSLHHVWWKTFGKLAVVPCTLQFVLSIRNLSVRWEGRLQAKGEKKPQQPKTNPRPELTSMWRVIPGARPEILPMKIKVKYLP